MSTENARDTILFHWKSQGAFDLRIAEFHRANTRHEHYLKLPAWAFTATGITTWQLHYLFTKLSCGKVRAVRLVTIPSGVFRIDVSE